MKFLLHLVVSMIILLPAAKGQFSEDFSSGNLASWMGNTDHFIITPQQELQLNAPSGQTTSWIYTSVNFTDSMVWDLYFKLDFAPSTSNQMRIYLGLDGDDISTATGYFIEIGATGDTDALEFKYQDGGNIQSIASSLPGIVADEPVEMNLRVRKGSNGLWEFFDATPAIPVLLFSATHDIVQLSSLNTFGFSLKYTDTRRDKFFFDNISIQPVIADTEPPTWVSLSVIDQHTVELIFNEVLDESIANVLSHYSLLPGNLNPASVTVEGNKITLEWSQSFISLQEYQLVITDISDVSGNTIVSDSKTFTYTQIDEATFFEILITEVMADPTPLIGLPDAEYIEIYNASQKIFDLSDYQLRIGSSERDLPDSILLPGDYVILTDEGNGNALQAFGKVIEVDNMPSLTNSGTSVAIINSSGNIIHEINYTTAWYHDATKMDGGWSLEMINPFHICSDETNWAAAMNLSGGTPGNENSQWTTTPDLNGPELLSIFTGTPGIIELRFNEKVDQNLMVNPALYPFSPSLIIQNISLSSPTSVSIQLASALESGVVYQLLAFDAYDCLGNQNRIENTSGFGVITVPVNGDLLINEVLFNPSTGGSRFIEIINVSEKFIDLSSVAIARINATQQDIYQTGINEIIGPNEIFVFTPEPADILSRYTVPFPEKLKEATLPSWDDQSDNVSILYGGEVIDSFTYSSDWHHPVISDQNGVSLERISIESGASNSSNWHSASSVSGFATPTGPNSQMLNVGTVKPPYSITNRNFSPNDDGFKDFLLISFEHGAGNDVASIWVYDLQGREVHQVLSNETIGSSASIQWDGRNEEGLLAEMGIYLIYIQMWSPNGETSEYQESCALVKR